MATSDLEKASLLNDVFINSFNLSTPVFDVSDLPTTDPNECPESLFCTCTVKIKCMNLCYQL